jgi:hypothetical protein
MATTQQQPAMIDVPKIPGRGEVKDEVTTLVNS